MRPEPLADRIIRRYREGDYIHAGQPWHRRHPIVATIAVLFVISAIITYWYVAIPAVLVGGIAAVAVGRARHHRAELERLRAAADAELEHLRELGRDQ